MENITKKAYSEILEVLKKYKDVCVFNVEDLENKSKLHLYGIALKEQYGLDINPKEIRSLDWVSFGEFRGIGWFGEKYRRTISWSDDGRQPEDELLLQICFPTGAYIFGEDYPINLFQKFWLELKEYNPKYTDTANKVIYFSLDSAKGVFNNFNSILKKYHELNKEDLKQRRIDKIKKELEDLQKS